MIEFITTPISGEKELIDGLRKAGDTADFGDPHLAISDLAGALGAAAAVIDCPYDSQRFNALSCAVLSETCAPPHAVSEFQDATDELQPLLGALPPKLREQLWIGLLSSLPDAYAEGILVDIGGDEETVVREAADAVVTNDAEHGARFAVALLELVDGRVSNDCASDIVPRLEKCLATLKADFALDDQ